MAEQDIQIKVTVDASQATAALKGVSQAAGETAKQTEKVGDAADKSKTKIGQYGSALGLAGQAAGQLSPALGSVISVAGSATGVIQGLTTAGLGPLGMAIGVISVAVTAGVGLWKTWSDEQKKASDSLKQNIIPTLDDLISKLEREKALRETRARLARGMGTAVEQEAFTQEAEAYASGAALARRQRAEQALIRAQEALSETVQAGERMSPAQRAARDRLRAAVTTAQIEQEAATAEFNRAQAVIETRRRLEAVAEVSAADTSRLLQPPAAGTSGTRGGGGARRPTLEQLMQQAAGGSAFPTLEGLDMETLGREPEAMAIAQSDKSADIEQQRYLEQLDRNRAYLEEREAQEKEAAERLQAINDTVFQALESAFSSSVNAWLDGSMSMGEAALEMVKNVAKSLASEAIIQGLKQTALGLSALAVGSPTAAGHFAAAGKWAAVGVAAGVVGAASGAFGGGGGGGGAGPAAATGGPALTAGAREGAGTTVVINWGSSGLVYAADRAQLGRDISGMISEANGRLGRGM